MCLRNNSVMVSVLHAFCVATNTAYLENWSTTAIIISFPSTFGNEIHRNWHPRSFWDWKRLQQACFLSSLDFVLLAHHASPDISLYVIIHLGPIIAVYKQSLHPCYSWVACVSVGALDPIRLGMLYTDNRNHIYYWIRNYSISQEVILLVSCYYCNDLMKLDRSPYDVYCD